MRVLWLSSSPSLYKSKHSSHHYNGAGWISSLEELICLNSDISLGICFLHPTDFEKSFGKNSTYYPILNKKPSRLKRFYNNLTFQLEPPTIVKNVLAVIDDFKPDIIQVFGFENSFADIQSHTSIPVVVHIQGLVNPLLNSWYPPGINSFDDFFLGSNVSNVLKANNKWFNRKQFENQAKRELAHFKITRNVMGRTNWDKDLSALLNPNINYYHIDEVLRNIFYETEVWKTKERSEYKIFSTISPSTYKGYDLILKTGNILKKFTDIKFKWIVGGSDYTDPTVRLMEKKFSLKYIDSGIKMAGALSSKELLEHLLDSDIYVHPSYIENSSNSIAEAQILGMPIIACNVGGLNSMINHNKTGILVASNDPYHMAYKIKSLHDDPFFASYLGENAHQAASIRHNKDKILKNILSAYQQLISSNVA